MDLNQNSWFYQSITWINLALRWGHEGEDWGWGWWAVQSDSLGLLSCLYIYIYIYIGSTCESANWTRPDIFIKRGINKWLDYDPNPFTLNLKTKITCCILIKFACHHLNWWPYFACSKLLWGLTQLASALPFDGFVPSTQLLNNNLVVIYVLQTIFFSNIFIIYLIFSKWFS